MAGSAASRAANGNPGDATAHPAPAAPGVPALRSTSPYGTRSRNRGSRVNYAEDKDNDMDYEYSTGTTSTPASATAKSNVGADIPSSGSSRRASAVGGASKDAKDSAVGTPSAALAPATAAAGKKRKSSQVAPPPAVKDAGLALSNMPSFDNPYLKDGRLLADDGTPFSVHDHIYLICEPPGEPYYLARIMEFLHASNDSTKPVESIRVNWYYRPKDIHRKVTDTRVVFASMHSDHCPLNAIRGKCCILHRSEIEDIDEYRKVRDSFYFEKMFDRYIQRYFDVIPTTLVRNVPEAIRRVLVQRWKYLLVEPQRGKELCAQMKECKRCAGFCASNDSVHCAVCGATYHMNCVRPPLLKKPSRGFAWACGPCNRAQERKLEARNTPTIATTAGADAEEEPWDDEEEELSPTAVAGGPGTGTETPSELAIDLDKQPTPEQASFVGMWQMRYLGQHCKVEDALDYDDRIFPRAASRLGPRHQAVVPPWPGRPVEYVKPAETKKKGQKNGSKGKNNAATVPDAAKEKRPEWVQDEPPGYIKRGEDDGSTSTLLFKIPCDIHEEDAWEKKKLVLDDYMEQAQKIARDLPGGGIAFYATNFMDKAAELLFQNDWNPNKAMEQLKKVHVVKDLKEPKFKPDETKRFEEGVSKFGSELHNVAKHVKTRKEADIVRFYYQWKKTPKGKEIWGNFEGRKHKKQVEKADKDEGKTKLLDDVADEHDDSAFDMDKAAGKKRGFECKFCKTRHSRQWRRAPAVAPGTLIPAEKGNSKKKNTEEKWLVSALCRRCAELWRRYAIQWEDPEEVQKKVSQGGGRAWKRRIDEELLKELSISQADEQAEARLLSSVTPQPSLSVPPGTATPDEKKEPPRKKVKTDTNGTTKKGKEKKEKEAPVPPPEPPKPKLLPCGVCGQVEEVGKQHAVCRDCKLTVHKTCYGVGENRGANKWICDMCANDKNPTVSTNYECALCPCRNDIPQVGESEDEKNSTRNGTPVVAGTTGKKKTPPREDGRKVKDADKYRPQHPRDTLKKTAGNNWAHVICAVWSPEVKFSDPTTLKAVEGIHHIPQQRWTQTCKVCKGTKGACLSCNSCHTSVHVGCAQKANWSLRFDVQPIKVSRRDAFTTVKIGEETGNMVPMLWCPEHKVPPGVHSLTDVVSESGQTALQLYVSTYKQADLSITGTVRKANLVSVPTKTPNNSHRRSSIVGLSMNGSSKEGSDSPATTVFIKQDGSEDQVGGVEGILKEHVGGETEKRCIKCHVDVSPLWWKTGPGVTSPQPANGTPQLTNGNPSSNRTTGLVCHRCHCKEESQSQSQSPESQHSSPFPPPVNGSSRSNAFKPLPPLSQFLAAQHQPPQQPAPIIAPPPPPPMVAPAPVAVPVGMTPAPVIVPQVPHIAQSLPPSIAHITHPTPAHRQPSIPPPTLPPHPIHHAPHPLPPSGHSATHPPPPPPVSHMSPHAPPITHVAHHVSPPAQLPPAPMVQHHPAPPPLPPPGPPIPQGSHHSPHVRHMSPHAQPPVQMSPHPPPHVSPHQPSHVSPHQPPHVSPHQPPHVSPHIPAHVSPHVSPPLPAHMSPRPLPRPSAAFTTAPPPQPPSQQPVPIPPVSQVPQSIRPPAPAGPPPPPPQAPREEPRRVMSGASGSPALANLLS